MLVFGGVYHPVKIKRTDCFPRLVKRNLTGASIEVGSESSNIEGLYTRGHYTTHFGGIKQCMVILKDFPSNSALFGLVSYNDTCILSQVDLGFCATTTGGAGLGFCIFFFAKPLQNP